MEDRKLRTKVAIRALELRDLLQGQLGDIQLGGTSPRRVEVSAPEGPSTGGGARANQSISLVSDDPQQGLLVSGTINADERTAELRGYPYLDEVHRLRFGRALDIPQAEYQKLLDQIRRTLQAAGHSVEVINHIPPELRRRYLDHQPTQGSSSGFWAVLIFLLLAGIGVAIYLFLAT